jgi:glycosyltransferase involved in cell wall biosynthesis
MKIFMDAVMYEDANSGGVLRVFDEIIPRICSLDNRVNINFLVSGWVKKRLPVSKGVRKRLTTPFNRLLRPRSFWHNRIYSMRQCEQALVTGNSSKAIWHSTYFTYPRNWHGYQVLTVHDMIPELFPNTFERNGLEQFLYRKKKCIEQADVIICVSETTKRDLLNLYDTREKKVVVIHNGFNPSFANQSRVPGLRELPQNYILYIGGRFSYKNFNLLLNSYSKWKHKRDIKIVVVGNPINAEEQNILRKLNIESEIIFVGNVSDDILSGIYKNALALIYPSLYEGFGLPLLEAASSGCPVVASRIPSTVEMLGEAPYYFSPESDESLICALDQLVAGVERKRKLEIGYDQLPLFSWERAASQTLDIYRSF